MIATWHRLLLAALYVTLTSAVAAQADEAAPVVDYAAKTEVQPVSHHTCARCGCRSPKCCCTRPCPSTMPGEPSTEAPAAPQLPPAEGMAQTPAMSPNFNAFAGNYGAARGFDTAGASLFGDFLLGGAFSGNLTLSDISNPVVPLGRVTVPFAVHSIKNSDNESAWARTRLILNTNYFDDVGGSGTNITREMLGFELASASGRASIGVRAPIFMVDPGVQATPFGNVGTFGAETDSSTSFGDLTTTFKYSLLYDPQGGNVLSVGAAVTANTGPDTIGGVTPLFTVDGIQHVASIQPYMAFYKSFSRPGTSGAFVQGFFASETPFNGNDTTFLFTDLAVGYAIRRPRNLITAIIPTFEVHMDNPVNKKQYTVTPTADLVRLSGYGQIAGTVQYHDQLNLTTGTTFVINRRSALALGVVIPVADTKPYNYELQLHFNRYFGRLGGVPYTR